MNQWAENWVKYMTSGQGTYAICGMEDTGTLQSLSFLAKAHRVDLDRVLVLRTASNYDVPRDGLTAARVAGRDQTRPLQRLPPRARHRLSRRPRRRRHAGGRLASVPRPPACCSPMTRGQLGVPHLAVEMWVRGPEHLTVTKTPPAACQATYFLYSSFRTSLRTNSVVHAICDKRSNLVGGLAPGGNADRVRRGLLGQCSQRDPEAGAILRRGRGNIFDHGAVRRSGRYSESPANAAGSLRRSLSECVCGG